MLFAWGIAVLRSKNVIINICRIHYKLDNKQLTGFYKLIMVVSTM